MSEANASVVDLTAIMPSDTADLHIVAPGTNKRIGWVITIAGPGHDKTVAFNNGNERKRLALEQRIESSRVNGRKWKGDDKQPDDSRREFIEGLVARIVTWTPVDIGAGPVAFSDKAAVELLLNPKMGPFVAQIVDFLLDERSFTTGSATD